MKIYAHTRNRDFHDKLKSLYADVEVVDEHAEGGIDALLKPGELLFMDRIPPRGFFEPAARVLVVLPDTPGKRSSWLPERESRASSLRIFRKLTCTGRSSALLPVRYG